MMFSSWVLSLGLAWILKGILLVQTRELPSLAVVMNTGHIHLTWWWHLSLFDRLGEHPRPPVPKVAGRRPPSQPAGGLSAGGFLSLNGNQFLGGTPRIPQNPSTTSLPCHKIAKCNRGAIARCPPAYTNSRNSGALQEDVGALVRCPVLLMDGAAGPQWSPHPCTMASRQTSTNASPHSASPRSCTSLIQHSLADLQTYLQPKTMQLQTHHGYLEST